MVVVAVGNRLRIPDEVLSRLGERGVRAVTGPFGTEQRGWAKGVEIREASASSGVRVVGYASTYDQPYPIWGGPEAGGFNETIAPGAFDKSVRERKDDVRFLINHEGSALARTVAGTMTLTADDFGLLVDAELDRGNPDVVALESSMRRGDMDQMSFAFEVLRQEWSPDWSERRILEVRLFDVSVVTYPANDQTMALIGAEAERPVPSPPVAARGMGVDLARAQWYRLAG
jgi:HK97 family phage prohead protease